MSADSPATLDADAYLRRVGYEGPLEPTAVVLDRLHLAHATHIPFENVDAFLGRPVRLGLDHLQAKLVRSRRGGYCFEQNTLFAAVLEAVGFRVTRLAARVRYGATRVLPRAHMLLKVEVGDGAWLADVGFGGGGPLRPVPLVDGATARQFLCNFRLARDDGQWVLRSLRGGAWSDLYAFTEEPQLPVDFEVTNFFTSTHPQSIFVQALTAQRTTPDACYVLRNWDLTVERGDTSSTREIHDDAELIDLLRGTFEIELEPADQTAVCGRLKES